LAGVPAYTHFPIQIELSQKFIQTTWHFAAGFRVRFSTFPTFPHSHLQGNGVELPRPARF